MPEKIELFTSSGERKYLTPEERDRFIATASELPERRERTFCLTLAHSGCRISEALALDYQRVDFSAGHIVFRSLKKKDEKLHQRAIPVPPEYLDAMDLVHDVRAQQKRPRMKKELLWPISRMTGWRWIDKTMKLAHIEGAMAHPHGLRHAFGVKALMKEIPLPLLQRWMGHADLETTAIYLQVVGNEEASFASRMWV